MSQRFYSVNRLRQKEDESLDDLYLRLMNGLTDDIEIKLKSFPDQSAEVTFFIPQQDPDGVWVMNAELEVS